MAKPKAVVAKPATVLRTVREKQGAIYADMETLSKRYGVEVFRIAGQRYFKQQREEAALREEIEAREAELSRLRQRSGK